MSFNFTTHPPVMQVHNPFAIFGGNKARRFHVEDFFVGIPEHFAKSRIDKQETPVLIQRHGVHRTFNQRSVKLLALLERNFHPPPFGGILLNNHVPFNVARIILVWSRYGICPIGRAVFIVSKQFALPLFAGHEAFYHLETRVGHIFMVKKFTYRFAYQLFF